MLAEMLIGKGDYQKAAAVIQKVEHSLSRKLSSSDSLTRALFLIAGYSIAYWPTAT
jgi:hypothetical protein